MQVIETGTEQKKNWNKEVTCRNCNTKVRVVADDLTFFVEREFVTTKQYMDVTKGKFTCPECRVEVKTSVPRYFMNVQ